MTRVRWGILGPGRIATAFARGLREAGGAELVAVGSRDAHRAATFARDHGVARAHASYAALVADPEVDAVYVATPHAQHEEHTLLCLRGGKHVLCEKPLALNAAQAERMIEAARASGCALMEAMWTRFLPALARTRELVKAGAIGDLRLIQADFGFRAEFDPAGRLFAPELGGGALLDLGVYPLNLAFWLCGEPTEIHASGTRGATGVDEEAGILLRHTGGRLSLLSCTLRVDTPCEARLLGTAGSITIARPWWAGTRLTVRTREGGEELLDLPSRGHGYTHEAEAFMDLIRSGRQQSEVMPLAESLAVLRTMDAIRARWGLRYPSE